MCDMNVLVIYSKQQTGNKCWAEVAAWFLCMELLVSVCKQSEARDVQVDQTHERMIHTQPGLTDG